MLRIGLTGGIASGKTLVSDRFRHHGVAIIDADVIARQVVQAGSEGLAAVVAEFGTDVLNEQSELNRAALRRIIFSDTGARQRLDALLHPLIRAAAKDQYDRLQLQDVDYVIHAIPLLVETQQQADFDRVLVVDVPEAVQLQRLMQRDTIDLEAAQRILAAQASRQQRLAVADDVIDNTGTIEQTQAHVDALHTIYRAAAGA